MQQPDSSDRPDVAIEQHDDRYELLASLSAHVPISAASFMFDFGWDGQRFREALKGVRALRIGLVVGDGGDAIRIKRRCAKRASVYADGYANRPTPTPLLETLPRFGRPAGRPKPLLV